MKTKKLIVLLSGFHLAGLLSNADQVILKNGDKASGTVVKKAGDTLTLKSAYFGLITIPWDQVQEIKIDKPVTVVGPTGETIQGTVNTRDTSVEVITSARTQAVPLTDVVTIRDAEEQAAYERLQRPSWADLWTGTATFALAGTQGNAETRTMAAGATASRITNNDKTTVYFAAINSSALVDRVDASTARAARGGIGYSHNLTGRLFVNAFNDYEYDRFQNLDLRIVVGGGPGYIAWENERGRLDLLGGIAWNRESFSPPGPALSFTRNSAEVYFGDDYVYKVSSITSLTQSFRFFPNLSDTGQYRANFDAALSTRLFGWLTWNITLSDRYLSNPVPGRRKNDFLYATGIGIQFAR